MCSQNSQISDEAMLGRQYIMANCLVGIPVLSLRPKYTSPSELMGRQFGGLLPLFQDHGAPESVQEHIMLQKEKEKCRHDAVAHDLPVVPVGVTVFFINKDLRLGQLVGLKAVKADPMWWLQKMED